MIKRKGFLFILLGLIAGVIITFSPGSILILFLAGISVFLLANIKDEEERNFLIRLFILGFGARIVLCLITMGWAIFSGHLLNYSGYGAPTYSTPYTIDDGGYYTLRAMFTKLYWDGVPLGQFTEDALVKHTYGFSGFTYVIAAFFDFFGFSPISSNFINCLLGALTAILVYFFVKDVFRKQTAKLAAILVAFFPSTLFWSITNLKETSLIFASCLLFWSVLKFKKTRKFIFLLIALVAFLLQYSMRSGYKETAYIILSSLLIYLLFFLISFLCRKKKYLLLFIMFAVCLLSLFKYRQKIYSTFETTKYKILVQHKGTLSSGGKCYRMLSDDKLSREAMSNSDFFKMLTKGWFHFMLQPFVWNLQSPSMVLSSVQMVPWYFLLIFAFSGIFLSLRHRFKDTSFMFLYFLLMGSALSITGGNIGTTFRIRDMITPIILIYSSVGIISALGLSDYRRGHIHA